MHGTSRYLGPMLAGVTLGRVAFGYQLQTVASLTPYLVAHAGIDYATAGSLIGAYLLPGAFAALPLGLAGRRLGEERVLVAGLLLMALGNCIPALLPGTPGLAASRLVAGLGAVAASVMLGKVLADRFEGARFAVAMSIAVGAFPLGVGLCQTMTPIMLGAGGLPAAFVAGGALAAAAVLLVACSGRVAVTQAASLGWPSRRECGLVILAGVVWAIYNCGYYGYLSYVPAMLQSRGVTAAEAGWAVTIATWLNIPAIIAGGALVGRVGVLPVYVVGALALSAGVAGMALPGPWLPWCLLFGIVGGLHPSLIVAAGTLSARPHHRAVGMSLFYTAYYIGGTLFPVLCGAAADHFATPAAALVTAGSLSLLAIPLFMAHLHLARRRPLAPHPLPPDL